MARKKRARPGPSGGGGEAAAEDGSEAEGAGGQEEVGELSDGAAVVAQGAVIVVGTYDGGLLGFRAADGVQTFGYAPHQGCVRALHCNSAGRMASGGTDHAVKLFDLGKGVEIGEIQEHEDLVSCAEFWGTSTLVTGAGDGTVCIWRAGDWELLQKFRAHKAAVASFAIHPSGRLMASCGRDLRIRLWDMTRGTAAAQLSTEEPAEALSWGPTGTHLSAVSPRELVVVEADKGTVATYKEANAAGGSGIAQRVTLTAAMLLLDHVALLGDSVGVLRVLALAQGGTELREVCRLAPDAKTSARGRVKALVRAPSAGGAGLLFAAGMSSGLVEVWHMAAGQGSKAPVKSQSFTRVQVVDTGTRLTCLALWLPPSAAAAAAAAAAGGGSEGAASEAAPKPKKRKKAAKA